MTDHLSDDHSRSHHQRGEECQANTFDRERFPLWSVAAVIIRSFSTIPRWTRVRLAAGSSRCKHLPSFWLRCYSTGPPHLISPLLRWLRHRSSVSRGKP